MLNFLGSGSLARLGGLEDILGEGGGVRKKQNFWGVREKNRNSMGGPKSW